MRLSNWHGASACVSEQLAGSSPGVLNLTHGAMWVLSLGGSGYFSIGADIKTLTFTQCDNN